VDDPTLWYAISGMFVIAGLLHAARAARRGDKHRLVHVALGVSCLAWAAATALWRFGSSAAGYAVGGLALAIMAWSALLSARGK